MTDGRGFWDSAGGFLKSAKDGAVEGAASALQGVGDLVEGGYKLATDSAARDQAWETTKNVAGRARDYSGQAIEDPAKVYRDVRDGVNTMRTQYEAARAEAERQGRLPEFYGNLAGRGGFEVGSMFVPVGWAAKAGTAGKLAKGAGSLVKAADKVGDAGKASKAAKAVQKTATAPKAPVSCKTCPKTKPKTQTKGKAAPKTVHKFSKAEDFNKAANNAKPNSIYEFGGYRYETDELGRVSSASGKVARTPAGRNHNLQKRIGKEGTDSDVGFHIVGDRFGGQTNRLNVVPGNGKPIGDGLPNLNQGDYKRFENAMNKAASDPNNTVEMVVQPRYNPGNATTRPDAFDAAYRVNNGPWTSQTFINK